MAPPSPNPVEDSYEESDVGEGEADFGRSDDSDVSFAESMEHFEEALPGEKAVEVHTDWCEKCAKRLAMQSEEEAAAEAAAAAELLCCWLRKKKNNGH